ncbi:hypothetical protein SEA_BOBSWAGET_67 [Mycobacterium phage BobSwaget]|nr:hypothetical protein SEA_BOBSWAGET_67 [Mycobacterium phage BobSwaget]ASW31412.1 hypothetical protein SEA_LOKK_68 [Mycobacterium phage Lokk]
MALTRIATYFPEVVHDPVITHVDEPGWLYAQSCETWWKGSLDEEPVTALLVYRSPLVTDTSRLYAPISEKLLDAKRIEVIGSGSRFDPNMMGERGEFLVARMTHQADDFPPGPLDMDEVRNILQVAVSTALNQVMVAA